MLGGLVRVLLDETATFLMKESLLVGVASDGRRRREA
jgi:hypothetical protein